VTVHVPAPDDAISYEQWGVDFFTTAISRTRVLDSVHSIVGRHIEIGPARVGPGGIARMTAHGTVGQVIADRLEGDTIAYRVLVPIDLSFEVDLHVEKQHFQARLGVPLTLTAVALPGLRIFIDATPPLAEEVHVELDAQTRRASLLEKAAGVEDVLRRFVTDYVRDELDRPEVRRTRSIEVSPAIVEVWESIGPGETGHR
jgi:hypothetical protein